MNLIHGDCLAELKKLPDKSVDMVYLDLPYGQTACKWDIKIDLIALWIELRRVARSERTAFFFSCTTKFGFELFNHAPKGYFRWDLVWEKNRAAGFLHAYKMPMRKHEMVYCFAKKSPAYDVSSHSEVDIQKNGRKTPKNAIYGRHNIKTEDKINKVHKERLPTSIIKYDVDAKTKHRTSKPIKLMEFLLKYWSKEGDTILDPTMGSGTMGVACKNMNRNFIGIEMSEEFYNLAKERIDAE